MTWIYLEKQLKRFQDWNSLLLSHFSRVRLSATPWTTARQAPRSMGFSKQEYWSGLPFPSPVIKYEVSEVKSLSRVALFATPWTVAYQASSVGFSRQEYWVGCHFLLHHVKLAFVNFSVFGNKMFTVLPLRPGTGPAPGIHRSLKQGLSVRVGTRVEKAGM